MYDHKSDKNENFIGFARLQVANFAMNQGVDDWIELYESEKQDVVVNARLHIKSEFIDKDY